MTGAKTTIVYLCKHLKESRSPCQMFCPSAKYVWGKKHFFWLKLKFLCLNCRQYVKDLTKNRAKSMFVSSMPPFWIGFHGKKSLQASESLFVYPLLGRHSPQTSGFSKICFWGLGRSFQNKSGIPEGNSVRITETTSQTSHRDKKYRPERPING